MMVTLNYREHFTIWFEGEYQVLQISSCKHQQESHGLAAQTATARVKEGEGGVPGKSD